MENTRMTTSGQPPQHKYVYEQHVEVQPESEKVYPPTAQVVAKLPGVCVKHSAPMYGCVHGDNHYTFCEAILHPLSTKGRRSLN